MGYPRSRYVKDGEEGVYHCYCRCVRQSFLFGYDADTDRDYSHRKFWIVDRLQFLSTIFAIEVCAYAVLETHYHNVLRTRPELVAGWSDRDVAIRWLTLCPRKKGVPPLENHILALLNQPKLLAKIRKRLSSLSWFMGKLNEYIARAANKEDGVTGHFWEGRFKCQALLDLAAIAAGMVYVDLNAIRAGVATTPEDSDFTSIQERIRAWHRQTLAAQQSALPEDTPAESRASWLCPIASTPQQRGILQMTEAQYLDLVDRSGRLTRSDKRGAIDPELDPIMLRIGARPETWVETVSTFGTRFRLAAGLVSSMRSLAHRVGRKWVKGLSAARESFVALPHS